MKVLVPDTLEEHPEEADGVHHVIYAAAEPIPEEHRDAEVLVVWSNPSALLADAARVLPRLRLVQSLSAGSDAVLAAGFDPRVTIASGRSLHDATVAEHVLAMILAALRSIPALTRLQDEHRWSDEIGGPQSEAPDRPLITLHGARVAIWGFGSIAATLAPVLRSLGAEVVGVARTGGVRSGFRVVAVDDVDELLPQTDILVSLLPGTPENDGVIDRRRLALLPARSWVVNAGRGSVLDEDALLDALRDDRLAGAALDVFRQEPLPAESPLWGEKRIIITPHSAGGRPRGAAALLARNVHALRSGGAFVNVVAGPSVGDLPE